MPSLTNRLKLSLPLGNEYVNRAVLNKIFEDIDRLVMLQSDFDTAKKEIDDNLAKKVSKSGGTLTGDLKFDVSNGNREITATNGTNDLYKWIMRGTNFEFFNQSLNKGIFNYNNTTGMFNVTADTNLLKKTGDIMTDKLWFSGASKGIAWQENSKEVADLIYNGRNIFLRGKPVDGTVYNAVTYDIDKNYFNVQSETNLVKKSGDKMFGNLDMRNSAAKIRFFGDDNVNRLTEGVDGNGHYYAWNEKGGKYAWKIDNTTGEFFVDADNLVKKADIYTDWITPLGTPKPVPNGVDMNTIIDSGIWQANSNPNLPDTGGQWFIVEVFKHTSTYVIQRATRFASTIPDTYERTMNNGVWGAWKRVAFIDEVIKKSGDIATGEMTFRHNIQQQSSDGKNGIVSVINLSQTKWAVGPRVDGTVDWSKELSMSLVTGEVSVAGLKVKGERALTISDAEEKTPSRSGKDENGIFTTYEETQEDGKLWKRSVLSSPDADGNYLVRTVTYYKDGVAYKTKTFDLKYDEDGDFVKAVPR